MKVSARPFHLTGFASRLFIQSLKLALVVGLIVGPWPSKSPSVDYAVAYRTSLKRIPIRLSAPAGAIRVGTAQVDLVPETPVVLAGFLDQIAEPFRGVNSPCEGKALTISHQSATVTILAVDLLLVTESILARILAKTGLSRDQIFITATHTHSGPGGWGVHLLERLVAGTYDPRFVDQLTDRLADVVLRSRVGLIPAQVAFVQTEVAGVQRNRVHPGGSTNDLLSAWIFRADRHDTPGPVLATLAVFGAHATLGHPASPRLGGDYPAAFRTSLERQSQSGMVLFAAGTVGDASPVRLPGTSQRKNIDLYGRTLADRLAKLFASARFTSNPRFANFGLSVDLPPVELPFFSSGWRFSPISTWWVGNRSTYLHFLKIGSACLVGFPGDYSGELGRRLKSPSSAVATSFNGDYKGYLLSSDTFRSQSCYETRWMSFYGANLGDDLTKLAQICLNKLALPEK